MLKSVGISQMSGYPGISFDEKGYPISDWSLIGITHNERRITWDIKFIVKID
jgi:hypothetical protein